MPARQSGRHNRWYAYWRGVAIRSRRRLRGVTRTLENWQQFDAADYVLHWTLVWRRASPDPIVAAHGISMPTPRHNMLLATAEQLARTP